MFFDDEIPIEEELYGPSSVEELEDGGVEVTLGEDEIPEDDPPPEFHENLVDVLDEADLQEIGQDCADRFDADEESRGEWSKAVERGIELLGLKLDETNEPFEGACTAVHPLIIENAVKFQSKASAELFPAGGPVKIAVAGKSTAEKEAQATRVKDHMNWQLTESMEEYFPDMERLLFYLPIVGLGIRKTFYDEHLGRPVSEFIPADRFVISNSAPDLRS